MINRLIILVLSSFLVVSCGGGGGGDKKSKKAANFPEEMLGVWDFTTTITTGTGTETDEYYSVMKSGGIIVDYDYMGDTFDKGPNCYFRFEYKVYATSEPNEYEIDFGDGDSDVFSMTVQGGELVIGDGDVVFFTAPPSSMLESDFSPLC